MLRGTCAGAALILAFVAGEAVAGAQDQDQERAAAAIFDAGRGAFARGDFREAALAFEAAFGKSAHGGSAYNAALAWMKAKERARAADAFALALRTAGLTATERESATFVLQSLRNELGVLTIEAPSDARVSVAHVRDAVPPLSVHVAPGEHDAHARFASGQSGVIRVSVDEGETKRVRLAPTASASPDTGLPDAAAGSPMRAIGWITLSTGAIALGVGGVLGAIGLSADSRLEAHNEAVARGDMGPDRMTQDEALSARDTSHDLRTPAAVLVWGGLGAAAVGAILVLTAPSRPAPRQGRAHALRGHGCGTAVALCFRM